MEIFIPKSSVDFAGASTSNVHISAASSSTNEIVSTSTTDTAIVSTSTAGYACLSQESIPNTNTDPIPVAVVAVEKAQEFEIIYFKKPNVSDLHNFLSTIQYKNIE